MPAADTIQNKRIATASRAAWCIQILVFVHFETVRMYERDTLEGEETVCTGFEIVSMVLCSIGDAKAD